MVHGDISCKSIRIDPTCIVCGNLNVHPKAPKRIDHEGNEMEEKRDDPPTTKPSATTEAEKKTAKAGKKVKKETKKVPKKTTTAKKKKESPSAVGPSVIPLKEEVVEEEKPVEEIKSNIEMEMVEQDD